jgi:hypothetical protein
MMRRIVGVALMSWVLAMPAGAHGATTRTTTAEVPEAGIVVSYPAGWVNVPLAERKFESALKIARAQDSGVTRQDLHRWFDLGTLYGPNFIAIDRRSGDDAFITVRDDDFDEAFDVSSVDQLEKELRAETKQNGLKLIGVEQTSVGSHIAYRWYTTAAGVVRTASLFYPHPETNATVAITVTTDNNANGRKVADLLLDSVKLA